MPTQNSTQTYEMLKTYLDETADSFEKLDEEPGFLYRKTDGRTSLVFCARVDKELGFLLLSAYPGILVRTSYVPMVFSSFKVTCSFQRRCAARNS